MSAGRGEVVLESPPSLTLSGHPCPQTLTSSSLYQDRDSAVSTNQYSLEPPFIKLILLMVSQPLRITWWEGLILAGRTALLPRPPYAPPQNGWKPGSVAGLPPAPSQILAPYQPMQSQLGIRQAAGTGVGMDGDTDKQKANH